MLLSSGLAGESRPFGSLRGFERNGDVSPVGRPAYNGLSIEVALYGLTQLTFNAVETKAEVKQQRIAGGSGAFQNQTLAGLQFAM